MRSLVSSLGGIASTVELERHGHGLRAIDRAVAAGSLRRLRRGWVALPDVDDDRSRAVALGGALTCVSLVQHVGAWALGDQRLHVRTPYYAKFEPSSDIRWHRTRGELPGATDTLAQALQHYVRCGQRGHVIAAIDSLINKRILSRADVLEILSRTPARCAAYASMIDGSAQSGLETLARLALRSLRVRTRPQVWIDGVGRVDLLIGDRLVLELDGREFHSSAESFREDRRRDLALAGLGYRVLRLDANQVYRWDEAERVVRALVRADEHRWPSRPRHVREFANIRFP